MAEALQVSGFPDSNVDPRDKVKKEYLVAYAKAAFNVYNDCPIGSVGWKNRDEYERCIAYAMGKQPVSKYKPLLIRGKDNSYNQMVIDWSIQPILYSKRQAALGIQYKESQNYEIRINPIDQFAQDEVSTEIETLRSKIILREQLKQAGMQDMSGMQALQPEPGEPDDLDGINIIELGYRHRTAMEVEQVVELTFNASDYDNVRNIVQQDLFDFGFACVKDETEDNSSVSIRRVDPRNAVLNYCTKADFSDLIYFGELVTIPTNELIAMSSGQLTKEEVEQMYNMGNQNQYLQAGINSWSTWATFTQFWNKGKIQVLDLEFLSTDRVAAFEWTDTRGNGNFKVDTDARKEREADFKSKQYKYVQSVYRIKWIVGTDVAFDYGKQYNIPKEKLGDKTKARLSYHPVGINMRNMRVFSRTEALIPCADAIQMAFYKLQHALNSVVPKGYAIDVSALEEVAIGSGGDVMTPKQILDLYFNRGTYLFRSKSLVGIEKFQMPIIPMESGVGNEIVEFQNMITMNINQINQVLGLNGLTDASTPNPKTLNGATQAALQGTNNALSDLFAAERRITQKVAKNVVIRSQNIVTLGNADKLTYALGAGTVSILRSIKDMDNYIYSVSIEDMPTLEEQQEFAQQLQIAQANKEVTISDVLTISNIKNMKQKQMFLAYRVRKNQEMQQKQKLEEMQANSQSQIQSAQAAEQAKQQTLSLEYQLKMQLEQLAIKGRIDEATVQGQYANEKARIDSTGRTESALIQAKGRDAANIRDNATKILDSETISDTKIPIIDVKADLKSTVAPETAGGQPLQLEPLPEMDFSFDDESMEQQPQMGAPDGMGQQEMGMPQPEMSESEYQQQPTI